MGNAVEEGPDIKVQNPVLLPTAPSSHRQGILGLSARPVAVTVRVEDRLQLFFQQHRCCGLGNSIRRVRHPEHPYTQPVILRYLHRPHRPGEVAPRTHPVPQLVKVVPLVGCEPADADGVHARRSAVRLDLSPRLVDETLSNLKRLRLRFRSLRRLLPQWGCPPVDLACTAPLLRPHYRAFIAHTGRPAPVPRGTLPLAVSAARGPPSRSQGSRRRSISTDRRFRGDRFSCSMPAPATSSRHLYTGRHQGHTQAAPWLRASRGCCSPLSRGPSPTLGFGAVLKTFDASAVVHTCSSSRRLPAPVLPGLFPKRS